MPSPISRDSRPDPSADHGAAPLNAGSRDYVRIAQAIDFIVAARPRHPTLEDVAAHVGLSPFHLQRVFKRWAGVSPKQLMGSLTLDHAKQVMRASASVLDATYEVGLSGPSRLHDLFVTYEAMTPGDYKAQGAGLEIRYGFHDTPFGRTLVLMTTRGICGLEFIDGDDAEALRNAHAQWPLSAFVEDAAATGRVVAHMFAGPASKQPLKLLLRGTNFQVQVWSALMRVPPAAIVSYHDVARAIGNPKATRAVGTALASNPVAVLVPCHRVLRATGLFKNYKWTPTRRHALLAWEAARNEQLAAGA
ncbi:MAG: methylated-DNA--[protein]-cysteine S-methyltransferase [Rhodospirillaceae bacterium]|nr:methylated-DNA--[protein]-cysteine S-methyltransferase [Rhodospirillaceae bacterium]